MDGIDETQSVDDMISSINKMEITPEQNRLDYLIKNDKLAIKVFKKSYPGGGFQSGEDIVMGDITDGNVADDEIDNHNLNGTPDIFPYGQPNVYGGKCYDDEDFIYARLGFADDILDNLNLDILDLLRIYDITLDYSQIRYNSEEIYVKTVNIWHFVKSYFTTLSCIRPRERVMQLPADLSFWIDNVVNLLRYMLENGGFDLPSDWVDFIEETAFNEIIYGLNLVITHLKMLLNYCRIRALSLWDLEEKYIKKMFRLLNNMCIIVIYLFNIMEIEVG